MQKVIMIGCDLHDATMVLRWAAMTAWRKAVLGAERPAQFQTLNALL